MVSWCEADLSCCLGGLSLTFVEFSTSFVDLRLNVVSAELDRLPLKLIGHRIEGEDVYALDFVYVLAGHKVSVGCNRSLRFGK